MAATVLMVLTQVILTIILNSVILTSEHAHVFHSFSQVLSYRTERALLFLSVRVFTMERHTCKDIFFNRAAVFGECGLVCVLTSSVQHGHCAANLLFFLSVCMGGVWNCTENNCTGANTL